MSRYEQSVTSAIPGIGGEVFGQYAPVWDIAFTPETRLSRPVALRGRDTPRMCLAF